MEWYYISLPYATFAIEINKQGTVIRTAPIGKWMFGMLIEDVEKWVRKKKGIIKKI